MYNFNLKLAALDCFFLIFMKLKQMINFSNNFSKQFFFKQVNVF